eukprot:8741339-Pyramimonas_sp.AAC.1
MLELLLPEIIPMYTSTFRVSRAPCREVQVAPSSTLVTHSRRCGHTDGFAICTNTATADFGGPPNTLAGGVEENARIGIRYNKASSAFA